VWLLRLADTHTQDVTGQPTSIPPATITNVAGETEVAPYLAHTIDQATGSSTLDKLRYKLGMSSAPSASDVASTAVSQAGPSRVGQAGAYVSQKLEDMKQSLSRGIHRTADAVLFLFVFVFFFFVCLFPAALTFRFFFPFFFFTIFHSEASKPGLHESFESSVEGVTQPSWYEKVRAKLGFSHEEMRQPGVMDAIRSALYPEEQSWMEKVRTKLGLSRDEWHQPGVMDAIRDAFNREPSFLERLGLRHEPTTGEKFKHALGLDTPSETPSVGDRVKGLFHTSSYAPATASSWTSSETVFCFFSPPSLAHTPG
jgi:hypothetical protein